jgi:hypothetical protein
MNHLERKYISATVHALTFVLGGSDSSPRESLRLAVAHDNRGSELQRWPAVHSEKAFAFPQTREIGKQVPGNVPPGLTITKMSGSGWSCTLTSCNRSDVLAGGAS